jgi:hypothetical protein
MGGHDGVGVWKCGWSRWYRIAVNAGCFAIALRLLCDCFVIAWLSLRIRLAIVLQSFCSRFASRFAIALQSFCDRFAIVLQSFRNQLLVTLRLLCLRSALALQLLCNRFAIKC